MKNAFIRSAQVLTVAAGTLLLAASCTKDLDRTPTYDLNADAVYKDAAAYKTQLAKAYAGFAITGTSDPGSSNLGGGLDAGSSDYLRQYWSAQELTTDEAVVAWGDPGAQEWHNLNWSTNGIFIQGLYSRLQSTITNCNSYLAEATDDKLAARKITSGDAGTVATYRAEARFLRALAYYHLLDLYGNVAFTTENDAIGTTTKPPRIARTDLFAYIEKELTAIDGALLAPTDSKAEYGRANKAAAWALLAKMYLNAKVYTGTERNSDAAKYAKQVIDAGYSLAPTYANLFLADNDRNNKEIIFPIVFDGKFTQTYGGTTFMTHAAIPNELYANWNPNFYGVGGGWGGTRTTSAFYRLFPDTTADRRGRFHVGGQSLDIKSQSSFKDGYVPVKYRNVTSTGANGSDNTFVDIDFPMLRLGDIYLTYAEAVSRGGSGSPALALQYVNMIRNRAFGGAAGGTTAGAVTADSLTSNNYLFFLRERGRELHWEATRRTDLIRFGKFTSGAYLWPWKGGVENGVGVPDYRNLFPIPTSEVSINPAIVQNTGY
jgi:hypothetical protein